MNEEHKYYTYLIGWSDLNLYYYGSRWSKYITEPFELDLWNVYKTSSGYVHDLAGKVGDPDIRQIRKTFSSREECLLWEFTVQIRLNLAARPDFLNKWNQSVKMIDGLIQGADTNPFDIPGVREKIIATCFKKYGTHSAFCKGTVIRDNLEATNLERYGTHHTLGLEHVREARESAVMNIYGVKNPVYSEEFQRYVAEKQRTPEARARMSEILTERFSGYDWSDRNAKNREASLRNFGVTCNMNRPDLIDKRVNTVLNCPYLCDYIKEGNRKQKPALLDKTAFSIHMTKFHGWPKEKAHLVFKQHSFDRRLEGEKYIDLGEYKNMKSKKIKLKDLKIGDKIKSLDSDGNVVYKEVQNIWDSEVPELNQVKLVFVNGTTVECSVNHPIICIDKEGKQFEVFPRELTKDHKIVSESGYTQLVEIKETNNPVGYVDIEVADTNTFFAATSEDSEMVLTHNCQGGIRGGSATAYYPIWHLEVEDLLVLKNNKGIEDNRARHLDYGVSVNGLFYKRLIENKNITLFSPHDVPDMYEAFFSDPKEFARLYEQYEADNTIRKKSIPALEIFSKLLQERANTGRIYIFNADHTNTHSAFDASVAPVKQSNLCCLPGDAIIPVSEKDGSFKSIKELSESGREFRVLNNVEASPESLTDIFSTAIAYFQGIKKVFKLVLSNGDYIRCTDDHKLATIEGDWVEAKDSLNKKIMNYNPGLKASNFYDSEIFVKEIIEESEEEVFDISITEEGALPQFFTFFGESEYAYLVHNCEITLPTKPLQSLEDPDGEIALCTLAAVNLGKLESLDDLEEIMEMLVLALDLLLDYQDYPVAAAYHSTMARRMLGIGVINYAYYLAKNHVMYSDGSANTLTHELFEAIQYYGLKASVKLAKERGKCPKFNETMYAKGVLPIDTYRKKLDNYVEPNYKLDWETLRKEIQEYGLRNSTITAIAPTETSAQISNATNGIEPPRSYISIKQSKHGILPQVVPEYETLKPYYELAWQMPSNKGYLTLVGIMQKFIDQAISANTYYDPAAFGGKTPMTVLINDLLFTYDLGIKTLYYHNTRDGSGETVKNTEESEDCDSCKV